jgi:DNA-binding MarR family transcriptional regulator
MQPADPLVAILQEWREIYMRRSMSEMLLYAKESGLSMPQMGALFRIYKASTGVSRLGEHLGVTNAAASQMLERLVQQGLIVRSEDPQDRRAKRIILTEKGRQIVHESTSGRRGWIQELTASLSPQEKEQIVTALNLLIEKIQRLEEPKDIEA